MNAFFVSTLSIFTLSYHLTKRMWMQPIRKSNWIGLLYVWLSLSHLHCKSPTMDETTVWTGALANEVIEWKEMEKKRNIKSFENYYVIHEFSTNDVYSYNLFIARYRFAERNFAFSFKLHKYIHTNTYAHTRTVNENENKIYNLFWFHFLHYFYHLLSKL